MPKTSCPGGHALILKCRTWCLLQYQVVFEGDQFFLVPCLSHVVSEERRASLRGCILRRWVRGRDFSSRTLADHC